MCRSLSGGILILALGLAGGLAGCRTPAVPSNPTPPPPPTPAATSSAASPDNGQDAADLAQRTSRFARSVSPLLDQRNVSVQSTTTAPSMVQWVDPGNHVADVEPPPAPSPVASAAPATRPADQQSAAILAASKSTDSGDPLILPESADHLTPSASQGVAIPTDDYEKKLQQEVRDYPNDLGSQLDYELLRFVRDEPTPDLSAISQLPAEDREILAALLDGLNNFRDNARADSNPMLSTKIQPLLEMADRLRSQAELTIPTIALCTDVHSYGVYTPLDSPRMGAGKENPVVVYCEVGNFTSVRDDQNMWQTRLREELVLYTDTGLAVWPEKSNAEVFVDQSRNRRHDFFVARKIVLPSELTIGRYLLKVTLTDEQSNRVVEATTPVEIVAE
ncbi:MAG: hypothetical protein ABSG31_10225 [Tepidisphaeraceae bacterium]|jgi:hypothetical protein